ncbi:hypothetical protein K439DRAFT_509299 [Ramaria rubella]|nr:hypothetical protein K439DRAFT_509299 [Ramaria rubella]
MAMSRAINATCSPQFKWMDNTQGVDPCTIASILLGICTTSGVFIVPPLEQNTFYLSPTSQDANPCQCNTVAYSLLSACAFCQGGTYNSFTNWSSNCPKDIVARQSFPNQSTLSINIPPYAFLPLAANDDWDPSAAKTTTQSLNASETSTITIISTPVTALSTMSPSSVSSASKAGNNLQIIIVVVVVLTLIASLVGLFLFFKFRHNPRHRYGRLFTHPNRALSISSANSDTAVDSNTISDTPRSLWERFLSNIHLPRNLMPSSSNHIQPYEQIHLINNQDNSRPPKPQIRMLHPVTPPSLPSNSYHPVPTLPSILPPSQPSSGQSLRRPVPTRIDTLPIIQTISRSIPSRSPSRASSLPPDLSTRHQDDIFPHRAPQPVQNVPRTRGFKIEDTPTTTDGFPGLRKSKPAARRDFYNPEIGPSVTSLETYKSSASRRSDRDQDSDSVIQITRSAIGSEVASVHSRAKSRSNTLSSFDDDESSQSIAGSSIHPLSPATASSKTMSLDDAIRYGRPEARQQLVPASLIILYRNMRNLAPNIFGKMEYVGATGYTGIPKDSS